MSISIEHFHIGFEYEQFEMDKARYLNRGNIWVKKTYTLTSPRLHKIHELIEHGKIRAISKNNCMHNSVTAITKTQRCSVNKSLHCESLCSLYQPK